VWPVAPLELCRRGVTAHTVLSDRAVAVGEGMTVGSQGSGHG
jgi:hypothetical protein